MTTPDGARHIFVPDWTTEPMKPTEDSVSAYRELLRVPSLAVGRFVAPPGHEDSQDPHIEDEIYFVTAGAADLIVGEQTIPVQAGSIAYIPAGVPHRYTRVRQRLEVLVFFAADGPARRDNSAAPGAWNRSEASRAAHH